jgi:pentachlorophenol monooxygenase
VVRDLDDKFRAAYGASAGCAYLIRPDGYVAYRQQRPDAGGVIDALEKVFR